jgi:UDP-sulfoquinovose synthase
MLISPKDLAHSVKEVRRRKGIQVDIRSLPNPRKENETHQTRMETTRFKEMLLPGRPSSLQDEINRIIWDLKPYRHTLRTYSDHFMNAEKSSRDGAFFRCG